MWRRNGQTLFLAREIARCAENFAAEGGTFVTVFSWLCCARQKEGMRDLQQDPQRIGAGSSSPSLVFAAVARPGKQVV
jgi:hypothetical protein